MTLKWLELALALKVMYWHCSSLGIVRLPASLPAAEANNTFVVSPKEANRSNPFWFPTISDLSEFDTKEMHVNQSENGLAGLHEWTIRGLIAEGATLHLKAAPLQERMEECPLQHQDLPNVMSQSRDQEAVMLSKEEASSATSSGGSGAPLETKLRILPFGVKQEGEIRKFETKSVPADDRRVKNSQRAEFYTLLRGKAAFDNGCCVILIFLVIAFMAVIVSM